MPDHNDSKSIGSILGDLNQDANNDDLNKNDDLNGKLPAENKDDNLNDNSNLEPPKTVPDAEALKKAQESAAFIQTRYQKVMAELDKRSPRLAERVRKTVRDADGDRQIDKSAPPSPKNEEDDRPMIDLTVAEYNAMLKKQREETLSAVRRENLDRQINEDYAYADDQINQFIEGAGFTPEDIKAANIEAHGLGIDLEKPGGYTRLAKAMIKELTWIAKSKASSQANPGAGDAQKVEAALSVLQPGGGAAPAKPEKSLQRQKLAEMDALGEKTLGSILTK
jgi:hypothetical protein